MGMVFHYLAWKFCSSSKKSLKSCFHSSSQIPQSLCYILKSSILSFNQPLFFCSSMEHEETKQYPQKTPHTQHEQVTPDLVLATGLQDEDDTFPTLSSSESESFSDYDGDADFFLSQEFETDLQFLESEGSNYEEEEMEEDDDDDDDGIDVDELTYEELIELGDFIGKEKRGLSAKEISSCLHSYTYHAAENKSGNIIDLCVICQVEYEESEALVALRCDHPYHTDCITKWLQIKKVCPICSCEVSVPQKVD